MRKTIMEIRLDGIADKLKERKVQRDANRAAILDKHKPKDGKKLTNEQRLARIEELLGIMDE